MSTHIFRRTMMRVLPLTGITVAGAIFISDGFDAAADNFDITDYEVLNTEPDDKALSRSGASLNQAFSMPYERDTHCITTTASAAHLEMIEHALISRNFSLHAQAATRILHDRAFNSPDDCAAVTLLEINPFIKERSLSVALTENNVLTVSSFIPWKPPPPMALTAPLPEYPPPQTPDTPETDRPDDPLADAINEALREMERLEELERAARRNAAKARNSTLTSLRSAYNVHSVIDENFWDLTSQSILVVAAANEGNKTYNAKSVTMSFLDSADSLIRVGALDANNMVEPYSTDIAPDFVWYTAFDQGFCFPYYATNEQILDLAELYNIEGIYNAPIRDFESDLSGLPACTLQGTSFVAPDIGGFMTRAVQNYPDLHEMEIIVAAYLSTTTNIENAVFHDNARGIPFNDVDAGHGGFLPDVFFGFLDTLRAYKTDMDITDTEYGRVTSIAELVTPESTVALTFIEPATSIRTIGEMTFAMADDVAPRYPVDGFPETVTVYSPSGTSFDIPLRLKSSNETQREVTAGFSVSAFLGENAEGTWHIETPPGFGIIEASLEHVTADIYFENSVNRLIDHAVEWRADNADIMVAMDTAPWADNTEIAIEVQARGTSKRPVARPEP